MAICQLDYREQTSVHYKCITMASRWALWRPKSPAWRLFTQPFIQGVDQRKHQSSASLAFVRGIHRWSVNSPHKWPVTRKMFPFDYVIVVGHFVQTSIIYWKIALPENLRLSICELFRHWWHRKLSLWKPTAHPVTKNLSNWQSFNFILSAYFIMYQWAYCTDKIDDD